jgi:hypothetical protein
MGTSASNRSLECVVACHHLCTARLNVIEATRSERLSLEALASSHRPTSQENADVLSFMAFIRCTQARKRECR